jgi:hypothetical protein
LHLCVGVGLRGRSGICMPACAAGTRHVVIAHEPGAGRDIVEMSRSSGSRSFFVAERFAGSSYRSGSAGD